MQPENEPIGPGQRWYSTAEPELGLGTILRVQGRTVQIVFAGSDTLRQYALGSAPLLRAAFPVGGQIRIGGRDWTIDGCVHADGLLRYRCGEHTFGEGELDPEQPVSQADSRMLAGRVDPSAQFELRRELLEFRANTRRHPGWGVLGARIERIEHQLRIAALADQHDPVRLLLADEVGLGKTIEACLICARLIASERVQRVVVLVPDSLIHQWFIELRRRFNLEFAIYDEERCAAVGEGDPDANPFAQEQWLLAGIEWLAASRKRAEQLLAAGCDLALIDEAHHLQWSPESSSPSYDFVARLAERTPHLLLLSATPAQLGQAGHFARLRLLDPARYDDLDAFVDEQAGYVELSRSLTPLLQGEPLTTEQRAALARACAEEADTAAALIEQAAAGDVQARAHLLDVLIDRHGTGRVMRRNRRAAIGGFPTRIEHVQWLPASDDPTLSGRLLAEYRHDSGHAPGDEEPTHDYRRDPRMDWLLETLATIAPAKALLLCHSRAKVQALEDALRERSGITCARFHEDMSLLQRDRNAAWFADPEGARLLIASETGAEGRNFQFAQHLILWDLPADPDRLEQRIGRLDRIGQAGDVHIHAAALENSPQAVLQAWYTQGLDAFTQTPVDGGSLTRACRPYLDAAIADPTPANLEGLCAASREIHRTLHAQVAEGRDHLLELAAQRGDAHLYDALRAADRADGEDDFALRMLEHVGVQYEELGHGLFSLDPEYLTVDGLEALKEGPRQACLGHDVALARDDVLYLRADHPLIVAAGDVLLASERGNASFVVDELPPRSAVLEAVFIVQCVAAPGLDVGRWLPTLPIRIAVDTRLQAHPDFALSARARLRAAERMMDLAPHRRLLAKLVPPLLAAAREHAQTDARSLIDHAIAEVDADASARIERLQALALRNRAISDAQIDNERARAQRLRDTLGRAHLRLDALRLVVSPDLLAPPPRR